MQYQTASWQQPYGSKEDSEWRGFGHGDGKVEGELEGEVAGPTIHAAVRMESGHRTLVGSSGRRTGASWLNTTFLVAEGEIDEEREELWLDTFVCVNELAQGPPAIGTQAPNPFRQGKP